MSNHFWETIYKHNIAKMIGVCCRYTQNRQTAEDLAHDAFLVAIDKVSSFENKGPFEAWLRRIAVNVALQHLREEKKHRYLDESGSDHPVYEDVHGENPENDLFTFSEAELLEVISFLPDHHRIVFNLYVIDNFTHAQIAAQLAISEGTSKSHLARARKKIRAILDEKLNKNKARKRTWLPFLLSSHLWNMNHFIEEKLGDLSIPPQKKFFLDKIDFSSKPVPKLNTSGFAYKFYVKTGISTISIAAIWVCMADLRVDMNRDKSRTWPAELEQSVKNVSVQSVSNGEAVSRIYLSQPTTATISDNSVMVEKTKAETEMKNLKTLGGLLIAGLTIDSNHLTKALPTDFGKLEVIAPIISQPQKVAPSVKSNAARQFGTFYASRVFWSEADRKIFLKGDRVKVNLNTQKFTGSGTFSFINGIDYVVVDGKPMQLNETVELTDKKYNFTQLLPADAMKKYGEVARSGAVEISIAE